MFSPYFFILNTSGPGENTAPLFYSMCARKNTRYYVSRAFIDNSSSLILAVNASTASLQPPLILSTGNMRKPAHLSRDWKSAKPRPREALIGYWTRTSISIGAASQITTKNLEPGERSWHFYVTGWE